MGNLLRHSYSDNSQINPQSHLQDEQDDANTDPRAQLITDQNIERYRQDANQFAPTQPPKPIKQAKPMAIGVVEVNDAAEGIRTYIAEGDVIEGDLRLKTSGLRLAGHVKGRIYCEKGSVIVESTGVVDGGIEAEGRVIVDGQVGHQNNIENTGATRLIIRTPGLLAVLGNGKVYGNYHYGRIACYDDATIEGMGRKVRG